MKCIQHYIIPGFPQTGGYEWAWRLWMKTFKTYKAVELKKKENFIDNKKRI